MIRSLYRLAIAGFLAWGLWPASILANPAEGYPNKPVRIIIPFAPGGASDFVGRILSQKLGEQLNQQVIIDNKSGAAGNIGMEAAARSAPDGYTLYLGNIGTLAINPAIFPNLSVKPLQDFAPITLIADVPSALVVNTDWGPRSLTEALTKLKASPSKFNFATPGSGSLNRLEMEILMRSAGVNMVHVPYKGGGGPAAMGLVGGETQLMFNTMPSVKNFVTSGRMHALAVTSAQRSSQLPAVPTIAESGYPGFDISTWFGLMAPAGTAEPIVKTLHKVMSQALETKEIKDRLARMKADSPAMSPEAFKQFILQEQKKYEVLVKASGARVD